MTDRLDVHCRRARRLRAGGVRGRYAPSPTGDLHLGNLRTALLAWLQARLAHGRFILRMENLDQPRTRPGSAARIIADLRWLGLDWDEGPDCGGPCEPYTQSARAALYAAALARLAERIYPCYCSRRDIANAASAPHDVQCGPIYPGTCRKSTQPPVSGRPPAWRFRVDDAPLAVQDVCCGEAVHNLAREVGDFVVRRADGLFAYQLAVVVDDALMGVTDVLRGADLLVSTACQVALYRALELPAPRFWHVSLMHDEQGARLAKRDGASGVLALRQRGWSPARAVGFLAASAKLVEPGRDLSCVELLAELDESAFIARLQAPAQSPRSDSRR